MSWVRIFVHLVFSTKNREPFFNSKEIRAQVFDHIKQNAKLKDIWLDSVNGWQEHVHCLISLGKEQNISKIAQLIKGESAFWINQHNLTITKFVWQDDYWAVGVSESHVEAVRKYIQNQEGHHQKKSFIKEMDNFMIKYDWNHGTT